MEITIGKLLLVASSILVPTGLALLYLLSYLARLLSPLIEPLNMSPCDGLCPYLALSALGASLFILAIFLEEQIAGSYFGISKGAHLVKYRRAGAKPYGFTAGGLTRWVSFVVLSGGEDPELERFVELHEEAHAKFKHPAKIWVVGSALYGEMSALPSTYSAIGPLPAYVYVFSVALVATTAYFLFVLVRTLEVEADIYVFRAMGIKSHDLFIKLMRTRYGSWRQPLRSRLTHTQGEFVLLLGDPIAAHAPWEHLLLFSAASSTVLLPKVAWSFRPAYENPIAYYPLLFVGTLTAIYFLSLLGEVLLRRLVKARLTDRGYTNLARMAVGLSFLLSTISIIINNISITTSLLIIGLYIYYNIIKLYIAKRARRAIPIYLVVAVLLVLLAGI
ncbi:MAG: hypothetical protein ABWJ97_02090 [Thermoproteus sp.]